MARHTTRRPDDLIAREGQAMHLSRAGAEVRPARRRFLAVIDVPADLTPSCEDAVHWLESMIDRSAGIAGAAVEVTTYSTIADMAADEAEGIGAFARVAQPLPMSAKASADPSLGGTIKRDPAA